MREIKVVVTVKVTSLDSVSALLVEIANAIRNENENGMLEKEDGDYVDWKTTSKRITK